MGTESGLSSSPGKSEAARDIVWLPDGAQTLAPALPGGDRSTRIGPSTYDVGGPISQLAVGR